MDVAWYRQITEDVLALWLQHSVDDSGLFHSAFDRTWQRTEATSCTLVTQCRLIHNFCSGYELTGDERYLAAAVSGAGALQRHFLDAARGGWFFACDGKGRLTDAGKDMYGHAFVILALAHLSRLVRDPTWRDLAVSTCETVEREFIDSCGGLYWHLSRDFRQEKREPRSQNPVMHLFEALLELGRVEAAALEEARKLFLLVDSLLLRRDGLLPEYFNEDWEELPAAEGGGLWVGHAFEWAFLLSRAVEFGLPDQLLRPARRLLGFGVCCGIDPDDGGVYSQVSPELVVSDARKGWWEQCEAIRALLHFVLQRGRRDLLPTLEQVRGFADRCFVDHESGGWYMGLADRRKGSLWKLDYHVVGMGLEALRLTGGLPAPAAPG